MGGSHNHLDCAMNISVTSEDCMIVISHNKATIHAEDMGIQNLPFTQTFNIPSELYQVLAICAFSLQVQNW